VVNTDPLFSVLIILLSFLLTMVLAKRLGLKQITSLLIFVWHTLFCIAYYYYTLSNVADATGYYERALLKNSDYDWTPGTDFVNSFTKLLVNSFDLSYLNTFLVYNLFGVVGLLLIHHFFSSYWSIRGAWSKYLPFLIVFSPGMSFWSSAIGKDSPAFFASCLAVFASLNFSSRKHCIAISLVVMFLVRPYITIFIVLALSVCVFNKQKSSIASRILFSLVAILILVFLIPFILEYVGFGESVSLDSTSQYIEKRQSVNLEGSSSVDIGTMPLPLQVFTYLFRPLFFDASNVLWLVISIDNLVLLYMTLLGVFQYIKFPTTRFSDMALFNFMYFMSGSIALSMTTANLGIAIRQKTMFLPSLLIIAALAINNRLSGTGGLVGQPREHPNHEGGISKPAKYN
jgi:hypothetical protein